MRRSIRNNFLALGILVLFLAGCGPSDNAINTAAANMIAATQEFENVINTAIAQTQAFVPTPTSTFTPLPSSTPVPTLAPLVVSWEFNNEGDTGGWGTYDYDTGDLGPITVVDGFLVTESLGNDSMIYNRDLRIDANRVVQIEILMRVSAGNAAQLYFSTEDNDMNENQSFAFHIQASEEFVNYQINTQFNNAWRGIVTELRLDPTDRAAEIEIDHIRFNIKNSNK